MSLLQRRIVLVTGKGGVGKTTVSTGLGLAAAARGLRVLIAEVSGARSIPAMFGTTGSGYKPSLLTENLYTLSITPEEAIEDYVIQQIRFKRLFNLVFRNRIISPLVDGVPGLHDAVQLGKIFDLSRDTHRGHPTWDLVIVDAPATGHGLTMLSSAHTMMELTRAGPMYEGVKLVHEVLSDPEKVALVLVSLPEEMPASETIDLWARLDEGLQAQVAVVALNALYPPLLTHPEDWPVARQALADAGPGVREAVALCDAWQERRERQSEIAQRLQEAIDAPLASLPFTTERPPGMATLEAMGSAILEAL